MYSKLPLFVKRLNEVARLPVKGSERAAGYDLFSAEDSVVPARGKALIKTGISIAVPPGNYGRVAPRSGLAVKHFIDTGAGVIDEDYRGEVGVVLFNHSDKDFPVKVGDRIAQLIIEKISETDIVEVDKLDDTERGAGGFGSTGVSGDINKSFNNNNDINLKRKSPEGGFLNRDILLKAGIQVMEDDVQWKEWSILVLYSLCESELISVSEKKEWAKQIFAGNKKGYEYLRDYAQSGDISQLREGMNSLC